MFEKLIQYNIKITYTASINRKEKEYIIKQDMFYVVVTHKNCTLIVDFKPTLSAIIYIYNYINVTNTDVK